MRFIPKRGTDLFRKAGLKPCATAIDLEATVRKNLADYGAGTSWSGYLVYHARRALRRARQALRPSLRWRGAEV